MNVIKNGNFISLSSSKIKIMLVLSTSLVATESNYTNSFLQFFVVGNVLFAKRCQPRRAVLLRIELSFLTIKYPENNYMYNN